MAASRTASVAEFPTIQSRPRSLWNPSEAGDSFLRETKGPVIRRRFKNQRLVGPYDKPWLEVKDPRASFPNIIFWSGMVISCLIGGFIIWRNYDSVPKTEFCLSFEDNFETLDLNNWRREVQVGGFGTGSFDWTTTDDRNSYVDEQGLHIVPTLTTHDTNITPDQLFDGYTLNLTRDGSCTAPKSTPNLNLTCTAVSNYTSGATIPPVRSARLSTEGKHSIRYGRVEVVAKIGKGDWYWPAIWMMPEMGGAYGPWPASGEIDLAEFRGNNPKYYGEGGRDAVQSTIHWGPNKLHNRFWQTTAKLFQWKFPRGSTMWTRGGFQNILDGGGNRLADPWSQTGRASTPFDQKFFLILNVAVGGTNGYFLDGTGGKSWTDYSNTNVREFALANTTWYPTWDMKDGGMVVRSVKMWNLGKCPS
ncbi:hypothetical protein H072_3862 [Dactylellina haptotyla CBS 200.50]|uniref:GH16 domain-containing protein n=1 Tax=Dactylellina haptotyla (strain CBS 200.50) TaxID=1284197 RepID=S8BRL1_DACHA|nr:hypothetical protein H072_3862 [Dactylellina haptotyla CBS 200.50]